MEWYHRVSIIGLLCLSVFLCGLGIYKFTRKSPVSKQKRSPVSRMLWLSLCLIASVWSLRYAVGLYNGIVESNPDELLTWWEEFFNSFVHALQTFSMDEEYTKYILDGKLMFQAVVGGHAVWMHLFTFYASALNIVAPIAGGAIVLEVLASIFPQLRLRWSYIRGWQKKYFFSELNAASLALAKDIYHEQQEKKQPKPILIFTDTYMDDENEKDYELLLEAKEYGAICVREDLEHVIKPRYGQREYYLMDENESGNLQTLLSLTNDYNVRYIRQSSIYFFVQTDAYMQVEKQVRQKLLSRAEFKNPSDRPTIIPVMSYRNLVHNLFVNVPLYEPLVHKPDPTQLNLTIFGNGTIGTEALLSAYWFGQLMISSTVDGKETMQPCKLNIHVVSKDTPDAFWSKLDYLNPEICKSIRRVWHGENEKGEVVQIVKEPDEALLQYRDESQNDPYCQVHYVQSDLQIGTFWQSTDAAVQDLLNADYFVVALGDDAINISMAEKLRGYLGKKHIEANENGGEHQAVIAYAVFDSQLVHALNQQKQFRSKSSGTADLYLYAFGNLDQVYSCNNVYMSDNQLWASETGSAYARAQWSRNNEHLLSDTDTHVANNFNRIWSEDYENANYNHWASLARAMHVKYKVFSLGWIHTSLFDTGTDTACEEVHRQNVRVQCETYRKMAVVTRPKELAGNDKTRYEEIERKKHVLAWLEHRRWNAFTRTMGYQRVDIKTILAQRSSHKDMRLKLHACLVEARMPQLHSPTEDPYILAKFDATGRVDESSILKEEHGSEKRDRLDDVSYTKKTNDFKEYDYYTYELDRDKFYCDSDLRTILEAAKIKKIAIYCDPSQYRDVVCCSINDAQGVSCCNYFYMDAVIKRIEKTHVAIAEDRNIKSKRKLQIAGSVYLPKFGARFMQLMYAVGAKLHRQPKADAYVPQPVSTDGVALPADLTDLTEQIAENVHENWAQSRVAEGWRYGAKLNGRKKTTPCLVTYDQLPDGEKEYDRRTAFETLRLIVSLGYRIEKRKDKPDNNASDS